MMSQTARLTILGTACETVIAHLRAQLAARHIRTVRSFDLQSACASHPDLTCPHHEKAPCDCQLVVLLAYGGQGPPLSLLIHSHHACTEVEIAASDGAAAHPNLADTLAAVLALQSLSNLQGADETG